MGGATEEGQYMGPDPIGSDEEGGIPMKPLALAREHELKVAPTEPVCITIESHCITINHITCCVYL